MKYSSSCVELVDVEAPIEGRPCGGQNEKGDEGVSSVKSRVLGGRDGKAVSCNEDQLASEKWSECEK